MFCWKTSLYGLSQQAQPQEPEASPAPKGALASLLRGEKPKESSERDSSCRLRLDLYLDFMGCFFGMHLNGIDLMWGVMALY